MSVNRAVMGSYRELVKHLPRHCLHSLTGTLCLLGRPSRQSAALRASYSASVQPAYLEDNDIGDAGAQALAEARHKNATLTSLLGLYGNRIGETGARQALRAGAQLREDDAGTALTALR